MPEDQQHDHLSRITTLWSIVRQAHSPDSSGDMTTAQERIIQCYSGAIYRYLLTVLRSSDAADEVFQEFALKLLRGGFRNANQERGRFRDYLKTSVLRLATDYHRKRNRAELQQPTGIEAAEPDSPENSNDLQENREFVDSCRDEFLGRAWSVLRDLERETGYLYYSVLDHRVRNPKATSQQIAETLSDDSHVSKPITAAGVRKILERARVRFADALLDEVEQSLEAPRAELVEQELIDLGLHTYCGQACQRRYGKDA